MDNLTEDEKLAYLSCVSGVAGNALLLVCMASIFATICCLAASVNYAPLFLTAVASGALCFVSFGVHVSIGPQSFVRKKQEEKRDVPSDFLNNYSKNYNHREENCKEYDSNYNGGFLRDKHTESSKGFEDKLKKKRYVSLIDESATQLSFPNFPVF